MTTRRHPVLLATVAGLAASVAVFAGASGAAREAAPKNQAPPGIRGVVQEGSLLQADEGQWASATKVDYTYQWLSCLADGTGCVDVPRATDSVYAVRGGDVGHALRVAVTAANRDGRSTATSAATAAATALPPAAPHNTVAPAISGSPAPGRVLTAAPGTWTGTAPIAFSYRWRRCDTTGGSCKDTTAHGQGYKLSSSDVGGSLRLVVTAANAAGKAVALSDPTAPLVRLARPAPTSPPAISGTAQEGSTLTGSRGTWSNSPTGFDYQWRRCNAKGDDCDSIRGAHGATYTLGAADVGHTIRLRVTARNAAGSTTAQSGRSAVVTGLKKPAPARPQSVTAPKISGTARQGQTLAADRGSWSNGPTGYTLTWTRCDQAGGHCADIPGAHGSTYTLTAADVGHTIRLEVTAKNAGGSTTAVSAATPVTAAAPASPASSPRSTSPPTISGTAQEGKTLTGNRGTWSNDPTGFGYQWRRCNPKGDGCDAIGGAHGTTYTATSADIGHTIRFRVKATNADGSATATSGATAVVRAAARPDNTSAPTVTGTPQQGRTLTGSPGSWTHSPADFDYSWLRCDRTGGSCAAVGAARGTTYVLSAADVGNTVRFRVTARNSEGSTTATSAPTAVIQRASPPPPPPRPNGCPPGGNPDQVASITQPARLLVDALQSDPAVVTRGTYTLVVRFHVTSTCGGPVQGALVYATATPYNQFSIPPEAVSGPDGWATLVFHRLAGFPISSRQQLIAMFVRARKPGDSLLGGISTRRLVSVRVRLR
jgi:hypothetical protein